MTFITLFLDTEQEHVLPESIQIAFALTLNFILMLAGIFISKDIKSAEIVVNALVSYNFYRLYILKRSYAMFGFAILFALATCSGLFSFLIR
ncbi:MAG: hypothetical protein SPL05_00370 [Eubacteriales bacterium]|nr:hypothetical protein [Eubacteriales bacterium]